MLGIRVISLNKNRIFPNFLTKSLMNSDFKDITSLSIIHHTCDNSNAKNRIYDCIIQGKKILFLETWGSLFLGI